MLVRTVWTLVTGNVRSGEGLFFTRNPNPPLGAGPGRFSTHSLRKAGAKGRGDRGADRALMA